MSKLIKQDVVNEKISYLKIIINIIVTILLMELSFVFTVNLSPALRSIFAVSILILGTVYCFKLIYRNLAYYIYRIIDDELILERAIGRANYLVYNITEEQIIAFEKYSNQKKINHRFYRTKSKESLYFLEFSNKEESIRIVFEPNEDIVSVVNEMIGNK